MSDRFFISITGDLGSGKSTVARLLSKRTGAAIYSTGAIQRKMAAAHGMTTTEYNVYAETHPEIDWEIDNAVKELNDLREDLIVDSRMAWHFADKSYSVYVGVTAEEAAKRIFAAGREEEKYASEEAAAEYIKERRASELLRYKQIYNADLNDMSNYDLVVDSTDKTASEVADIIYEAWQKHIKDK